MGNESSRRFTRRKKGSSVEKVKRKDSKNRASNGEDAVSSKMKNLSVKGSSEKSGKNGRAQGENAARENKPGENGEKGVRSRKVNGVKHLMNLC